MASSQRSLEANQRGESGRKNIPKNKRTAGTIWTPQGMRKADVGWLGSLGPLPTQDAPYWMKYWMRILGYRQV